MRDQIARHPMPVDHSIHWKPLRDPHYVVASLQLADGGRRQIFVRQQVIAHVEAAVRAHGSHTVGLLLGQLFRCSVTGADYIVIEAISDHEVVGSESELAGQVAEALAAREPERHARFLRPAGDHPVVVGWYRGVHAVETRPSLTTAGVHVSLFSEPWQTVLVVSEGRNAEGAFFLRDNANSRWFCAPFYELLNHAPTPNQPMAAFVNWPQYITAESVVRAERNEAAEPKPIVLADAKPLKRYERPWLRRSPSKQNGVQRAHNQDANVSRQERSPLRPSPSSAAPTESPEVMHESDEASTREREFDASTQAQEPAVDRPVSDRPAPRAIEPGLADAPRGNNERVGSRRGGRSGEKLSIIDDRDQRSAGHKTPRRISDDDDTTVGDDVARYIAIARAEGFFIAAKFDAAGGQSDETLWVLNEPYSGLLLAVVSANSRVIDANLHYNLQTDAEGLKHAAFAGYRDPESKTIYVRETCMEALRARCRRLRATNSLLREWKVTPPISLLTPGEWESIPASRGDPSRGADVISDLTNRRIAELPPGVRSQFHLPDAGEARA